MAHAFQVKERERVRVREDSADLFTYSDLQQGIVKIK